MKAERVRMAVPARLPAPTPRRVLRVPPALAVALVYLASGAAWIFGSEWLLELLVPAEHAHTVQVFKGVGFVVVTSIALYVMLNRMMGQLQEGTRAQASLATRPRERAAQQRDIGRQAHSADTRRRRTIQMNTGAPTKAVTMPTSSSAGRATSRPATSARISSTAPARAEPGRISR